MQNRASRCKDFFRASASSHQEDEKKDGHADKHGEAADASAPGASAARPHERVRAVMSERALGCRPAPVAIEVEGVAHD